MKARKRWSPIAIAIATLAVLLCIGLALGGVLLIMGQKDLGLLAGLDSLTPTPVWTSIWPEGGSILSLAIDPQTPTTLYAGTNVGGVFKSTDGGASWRAVNTGLTDNSVFALAIDPVTPTTLYAGTFLGGVFKSTDGGASWRAVNTGLTNTVVTALAIDPQTPTTLYAGTNGGGVFKLE